MSEKRQNPQVIKLFSCATQLIMKFQLLIESKILKNNLKHSAVLFIVLINVKMPTIVGNLTFMSVINLILNLVEHKKVL